MNGINWWRRLGIVCCVMVTLGCISGCQWNLDNLKQYSQDSSARDSKKDETKRVFRFYLAATNEFNYNEVKYGSQYDLIWQQASSNEPLTDFKVQDYERLEQELVAAKEAGRSYEDLESTTDALLPILHDIVSDVKALDSYYKAKQYEKDNYAFSQATLAKLSALLEVLDPEQNSTFSDHFIEVPFDFSEVFWITTANVASNIPGPLLDRMEIIELSSYMEQEKLEIAKRYLVPKQIKKNGLEDYKVKLSDAVLKKVVSEYTREAGVRTLEKTIAKICRKIAYKVVEEGGDAPKVTTKNLHEFLGAPIFVDQEREKKPQIGYVNGLAWTSVGGVVLPCEATTMNGTGKLALTGSLGKVMQESGQAAMSYIRHNAKALKIEDDFYKKLDIHVHLPEGATPKDGPSAGITMTLAMVSILTNRKVRSDIAMTGEITLRGRVLPIGGLKEKLLAALSNGIKEVLIPKGNEKDIAELPDIVKDGLIITPVKTMDEVLAKALV